MPWKSTTIFKVVVPFWMIYTLLLEKKRVKFVTNLQKNAAWKAKCPIFKAIVAGFRGFQLPRKNRTLGRRSRWFVFFGKKKDPHDQKFWEAFGDPWPHPWASP